MPEKLLMPFTNKGKFISLDFPEIDTRTENQDSEKNLGPTGTGSATSANGTHSIACGHLNVAVKNPVTTVQARKWSAQLEESRFPNGNSGSWWRRGGPGRRVGWGWS